MHAESAGNINCGEVAQRSATEKWNDLEAGERNAYLGVEHGISAGDIFPSLSESAAQLNLSTSGAEPVLSTRRVTDLGYADEQSKTQQ